MPTVELRLRALPAHVRTARLVAVAVARRAGVDDSLLDEIRLAIGEACARAVALHQKHCPDVSIVLTLSDDDGRFGAAVTDEAPAAGDGAEDMLAVLERLDDGEAGEEQLEDAVELFLPGIELAVISGLVDDFAVESGDGGSVVRMGWPAARPVGEPGG